MAAFVAPTMRVAVAARLVLVEGGHQGLVLGQRVLSEPAHARSSMRSVQLLVLPLEQSFAAQR